jgi:hypothetical protein
MKYFVYATKFGYILTGLDRNALGDICLVRFSGGYYEIL